MKSMKEQSKRIGKITLALFVPVVIFYLFEWYTHNPWEDIRWDIQLLNIFFFEMVMILLYSLIGRLHVALVLETVVFMIYGLANYFVLSFRSQPIMPWDFLSLGTAATVAGDFSYIVDTQAGIVLALFILLIVLELLFCRNQLKLTLGRLYRGPLKSWAFRAPAAAGTLALLVGFVALLHNEEFVQEEIRMYDKLFTPTVMSERDGTAVAFLLELQYIAVDKPEGYDAEEAAECLAGLAEENVVLPQEAPMVWTDMPNIVVIMDEAFSDLAVLGEFETNEDYMPFIHSLQAGAQDTVSGTLHVSVKGGNTANTEFEFLTGHTMAFLPEGSIPYQQYIDTEQASLASWLKELGYSTLAVHPYYASGWDRELVYPLIGFEDTAFIDKFSNAGKVRKYVSDGAAFDYIISQYENKEEGKPFFCFEVTMQNHSGYTEVFENFTPDIRVEGAESKSLEQYLSLLKETDSAVEDLLDYFAAQEEETIVVFFGDHQPADSVAEPIWNLQGKTGSELTDAENALRYEVPFFIWANYDIEEQTGIEISANYLSTLVLETAGLPMPAYQTYLAELRGEVPILTSRYMVTSDGYAGVPDGYEAYLEELENVSETEQKNLLTRYRQLQYYLLFDGEE
ncbi:MAG: sulfatase-like hydrolase/transferase [Lachnospiraceae bacterium]|nr:sulfatase-like hydrolase/transferase [Lachnospiraceae bacterium]MBQ7781970.1 sulfatase-like hydrolase/transferase [Lachnospiraceae bacterium]